MASPASVDEASSGQDERGEELIKIEGVMLPEKPAGGTVKMEQHVCALRQMKLRHDDVFVCAYPKTGTHWTWEMMSMLRKGKADYEGRSKVQLMMEYVDRDKLDEQPSPRILNTHLPFSMLPVQEMKDKRAKIVHVYRNPKDVFVSFYLMAKTGGFPMGKLSFPEYVHRQLSNQGPYGGYFEYLRQVHVFTQSNPEVPLTSISYEDMKKDPVGNVRRLADFLQVEVSDQLCEDIALACNFHKMKEDAQKKAEVNFGGGDVDIVTEEQKEKRDNAAEKKKPVIFRKGEVGDWKNHLTVALSEAIDAMAEEKMQGLPFTLTYTLP